MKNIKTTRFFIYLILILYSCKNDKNRNADPDLIYPQLTHITKATSWTNLELNKRYEDCKKMSRTDSIFKNTEVSDSLFESYCICFVEKISTQLTRYQLSDKNAINEISLQCFRSTGILDKMKGDNHSEPNRDKYTKRIQPELEHLVGVNGWEESVIISIHENCITNKFMKDQFTANNILSEFNNYCNCLTSTIVNSEDAYFLASKSADGKISEYSDKCLKPYLQTNEMGWGYEDIEDIAKVFRSDINWVRIAAKNNIPSSDFAYCIANTMAKKINISDLSNDNISDRIKEISKECIAKLK